MEKLKIDIFDNYITELQNKFNNLHFKRLERKDGMYLTNIINKSIFNDSQIFKETQVKRTIKKLCASFVSKDIQNKLSYFSKEENKNESQIYQFDKTKELVSEEIYAVQNIGHATQLIQIPDFNILTDPVFGDLNWLLYPSQTQSYPAIEELPKIDVIIVSHNHRDHVDKDSLHKLLVNYQNKQWEQPNVFVPMGDKQLIKDFGFNNVEEVEWYTKISASKKTDKDNVIINFISIPADHRSGRYIGDHHQSLVTGWIISPENKNVIFKYSGDTRSLTVENQLAVDAILWNEINAKRTYNETAELPDIICFEPGGPNYTRSYMDVTHQSTSYSALLKFIEAENMSKFSGKKVDDLLCKIRTIIIHHNKFELGPDRFNENIFIFKKLYRYLSLNEDELNKELEMQEEKLKQNLDRAKLKETLPLLARPIISTLPKQSSLLIHSKDFIIRDMLDVLRKGIEKKLIKEFLLNNTLFPKIGERLIRNKIMNSIFDVDSIDKYKSKS